MAQQLQPPRGMPHGVPVNLIPFAGLVTENFQEWLRKFARLASAQEWDNRTKCRVPAWSFREVLLNFASGCQAQLCPASRVYVTVIHPNSAG